MIDLNKKYKEKDAENKISIIEDTWSSYPERFSQDMVAYQNWFDSCNSIASCIAKGEIDFHNRILTGDLYEFLGDPRDKTALDIGFGGGRLMLAASRIFKNVQGVDILNANTSQITKKFLEDNGASNFKLFTPKLIENIEDSSVDFVYSYITFQHFSSIEYFHKYFSDIKRVLKPGGVGSVYFGLIKDVSKVKVVKKALEADGFCHWHDAFKEGSRESTIYYNPTWVKGQIEDKYNMTVINMMQFSKNPWTDEKSSQFCVRFARNEEQ